MVWTHPTNGFRHGGNVAGRLGDQHSRPGETGILEPSNVDTSREQKIIV